MSDYTGLLIFEAFTAASGLLLLHMYIQAHAEETVSKLACSIRRTYHHIVQSLDSPLSHRKPRDPL